MQVGDRIKNLREEMNIERSELAKKIGVTYHALSKYETNERQPDYEILKNIADFFSVSVDYLLGITDIRKPKYKENEPKTLEDYIKDAETLMLYGEIMDESDKQALLTAIKVAYETAIKKKNKKE